MTTVDAGNSLHFTAFQMDIAGGERKMVANADSFFAYEWAADDGIRMVCAVGFDDAGAIDKIDKKDFSPALLPEDSCVRVKGTESQ